MAILYTGSHLAVQPPLREIERDEQANERIPELEQNINLEEEVRRAERDSERELEQQWVRAPVEGLISDIRITGVTTKGVSLEVVLLERSEGKQTQEVQVAEVER